MARISIKPIEPLELEFSDGTIKGALFNNEAFVLFADEFESMDDLIKTELKNKPYDFVAKILYCGMKVIDKSITLDEAYSIVIGGGEPLAMEIINSTVDNFMLVADEESKKKFHKEVEKITKKLMD